MAEELPPNLCAGVGTDDERERTRKTVRQQRVKIGIVGAGKVGRKVAMELALCGCQVSVWDSHVEDLAEALHRDADASAFDPPEAIRAAASSIVICERRANVMLDSRAVIVATVDNVEVKKLVVAEAFAHSPATALVMACMADAGNSAYVDSLLSGVGVVVGSGDRERRSRMMGVGFWPPIFSDKRVAITAGSETSEDALRNAAELFALMGKRASVIRPKNSSGAAVNAVAADAVQVAAAAPQERPQPKASESDFPDEPQQQHKAPQSAFSSLFKSLSLRKSPSPTTSVTTQPPQQQQPQQPPPAASPAQASPPPADCVVCLENKANMAVVPCGHKCVCTACSAMLNKCPMCRQDVTSFLRIFE